MFDRIQEDIRCVFERDPAAQSVAEILVAYPGLHAILFHRLGHALWQFKLGWLSRLLSHVSRWLTGIEIHPGARIGRRLFIDHGMGIVIGETAIIGNDCTLYHGVTLGGTSWQKGKRHPTLGDGVVVGAGAKILGPILIGNGARVGSNSVVLKNIPDEATVVGIPGHILSAKKALVLPHRKAIASKIGFDAYGATKDMTDPVADAINHMLDHIHLMDRQIEELTRVLKERGIECQEITIPKLDDYEIETGVNGMVDD
jgi:serine O-acetyltransferase